MGASSKGSLGRAVAILYIVLTPLLNPSIYTRRKKDAKAALSRFESWYLFTGKKQWAGCHDPHPNITIHQGVTEPSNRYS